MAVEKTVKQLVAAAQVAFKNCGPFKDCRTNK